MITPKSAARRLPVSHGATARASPRASRTRRAYYMLPSVIGGPGGEGMAAASSQSMPWGGCVLPQPNDPAIWRSLKPSSPRRPAAGISVLSGVPIGSRSPRKRGPYCTPKHKKLFCRAIKAASHKSGRSCRFWRPRPRSRGEIGYCLRRPRKAPLGGMASSCPRSPPFAPTYIKAGATILRR